MGAGDRDLCDSRVRYRLVPPVIGQLQCPFQWQSFLIWIGSAFTSTPRGGLSTLLTTLYSCDLYSSLREVYGDVVSCLLIPAFQRCFPGRWEFRVLGVRAHRRIWGWGANQAVGRHDSFQRIGGTMATD